MFTKAILRIIKIPKSMRFKFLVLFGFLLSIFSFLLIRLVEVALLQGQKFFTLAESNRYFIKKYPAERAVFLDRYGQALVRNEKKYFKYSQADRLYSDKEFLTTDEALNLLATASAQVGYDFKRVYPYQEAMSSVLGYLSPVTEADLANNPNLAISSRLGRMGLEQFFDQNMQAKGSVAKFEINALGKTQRLISLEEPVYGQNIKTTLDPDLSKLAYQAMADKRGAVVIMDASNGEILTLISAPSFDGNAFEQGDKVKIANYLSDERQVFFNRSVSGAYPPGSVFKLVTALAALQEGVIDENTVVDDQGTLKVGGSEFANWYFTQYGRVEGAVDVKKALTRSNDIFFYKAAEWLGPTKLAEYARMFGLGIPVGIELNSEVGGLVPDPVWKEQQKGENWYLGNTYHFGIGQGDLLVTPLQIASVTQAIANQGKLCQASLLSTTKQNCRDLAIDAKNLEIVLAGMVGACSQGGTAYPLFPYNTQQPGMIACKTGTAEFGGVDERGYRKTHAWTTAIVEFNREVWPSLVKKSAFPEKLVITVLVESDTKQMYSEGSADAAPVIKEVLEGI